MTFTFQPMADRRRLDAVRIVGDIPLKLRAENVRLQTGGISAGTYATVRFYVGSTLYHTDTLNVDDGDKRHGYANKLYGTPKTPGKIDEPVILSDFPQPVFAKEFMDWSVALWQTWIGASAGGAVKGDLEPSAPPWSVPGLVMKGSPVIWAGDRGANKSTLMRLACQSLHYGIDSVINIRDEGPCVWVNAEEPPEEHTRQFGNVNGALGLPRDAEVITCDARGMSVTDMALRVEKLVRESKAKHVFIDSLSRLAGGGDLNTNATANMIIDSLAGIGTSVTWIGHTGHSNVNRLGGSKHFENAARVMVLVQGRISLSGREPELRRAVRARVYKANGAAPTGAQYWALDYDRETGLVLASPSRYEDWPVVPCDYVVGEDKRSGDLIRCNRKTWDGISLAGEARCARHREDEGLDEA